MTLHEPKRPAAKPRPRREAPALTIGDVLGEKVRAVNAERSRRAELDAMGFRAVQASE